MKNETKRLILRPLKLSDAESIRESINDLDVTKWLLVVPHPYTKKDAKDWVKHNKEKWRKKNKEDYTFGIELKGSKNIIGGIGLHKINKVHGKAEVGYWLGKRHWKKGYGTEALDALLKFAFNKLKLRRVEAGVFKGNPSSGKLLEKFGAKLEGTHRKSVRSKATGKIMDENFYGLLKEEWKKLK